MRFPVVVIVMSAVIFPRTVPKSVYSLIWLIEVGLSSPVPPDPSMAKPLRLLKMDMGSAWTFSGNAKQAITTKSPSKRIRFVADGILGLLQARSGQKSC